MPDCVLTNSQQSSSLMLTMCFNSPLLWQSDAWMYACKGHDPVSDSVIWSDQLLQETIKLVLKWWNETGGMAWLIRKWIWAITVTCTLSVLYLTVVLQQLISLTAHVCLLATAQFGAGWYFCTQESPYMHSTPSQKGAQCDPWNNCNVGLLTRVLFPQQLQPLPLSLSVSCRWPRVGGWLCPPASTLLFASTPSALM